MGPFCGVSRPHDYFGGNMKSYAKLLLVTLFTIASITGCDGCFDDEVTNKVDAPNFTFVRGTNYTVKLSSETRAATIKYTLDGTDPKTSDTAVEGTEVTIDYFTTIKAYAYKEGKRESKTLSFGLPGIASTRKVRYNSDNTVYDHIYFSRDINDKKKVVKFYDGKGSDGQWFTDDDDVQYYILYNYDGDTLTEEYKYTGPGEDGKWFTADDTYEWMSTYTVQDGDITGEIITDSTGNTIAEASYSYDADGTITVNGTSGTYPAKDINIYEGGYGSDVPDIVYTGNCEVTGTFDFTYADGEKESLVTADGVTWTYNDPDGVNKEYTYEYSKDSSGNPATKTRILGYGTDTEWGYTEQTFDADGNVLTATQYWDNAGANPRAYYEYVYDESGNEISVTKYKTPEKTSLRYWKETEYDSNGSISTVNYFNRDEEKEKYEEYVWDTVSYYLVKQRPDVASHLFTVALETHFTTIEDGSFIVAGNEYDHNGDPVSEIVDDTDDIDQLSRNTADKVKYILDNTEVGSNSLTISGSDAGECQVLISTYDNSVNIVLDFNEYNDGDVIIDGILDLEITGTVDVSGEFSGSGEGFLDGDIYVADANPGITNADYITVAAVELETDADGNITREVEYISPGDDGDWVTFDGKIKYIRMYEYSDGNVTTKVQYNGTGDDKNWDTTKSIATSDDKVEYRIEYEYQAGSLTKETVYRNYGIHGESDGSDDPDESLKYYLGWRLYWDVEQRYEIDWDDDYWHEDEDDEDRLVWSIEESE